MPPAGSPGFWALSGSSIPAEFLGAVLWEELMTPLFVKSKPQMRLNHAVMTAEFPMSLAATSLSSLAHAVGSVLRSSSPVVGMTQDSLGI